MSVTTKANYWKTTAAKALESGYRPGNRWERMLRSHLESNAADLLAELESAGETEDYLISRTSEAMTLEQEMIEAGNDPQAAHEAAMEILLPTATDTVEDWEIEGATEDMIAGMTKALANLPAAAPAPAIASVPANPKPI